MTEMHDQLPSSFCWTRFGTEAGEAIDAILARKEVERVANGGLFLWGIGNSVAPGLVELVSREASPALLFSPIRSRPRKIDVSPPHVCLWTGGETLGGDRYQLPDSVRVTSGSREPGAGRHYALVCHSDNPLQLSDLGTVDFSALRNLVSGRPLGVSQVTAVVSNDPGTIGGTQYAVSLQATLVPPYFVRLDECVVPDSAEYAIA